MKVIGFRAEPKAVHWAVVEGTTQSPTLVACDSRLAPKMYGEAESLGWYRNQIRTLIDTFKPDVAAVRYPEPFAKKGKPTSVQGRARIEGVILEAAYSKGLRTTTGALTEMTARLGSESAKAYLDGDDIRGLDWSKITDSRREAILVAVASLGG